MHYKTQLMQARKNILSNIDRNHLSYPVYLGFENTTKLARPGLANIYVSSEISKLPQSVSDVFEASCRDSIVYTLPEFMCHLNLFHTHVFYAQEVKNVDTLYESLRKQGMSIIESQQLIDGICANDAFKVSPI
jgi:hypothetical protein